MTKKEMVLRMAADNNGIILTKQLTEVGIYRSVLKDLEDEGKLTKVQHGVYVTEDGYADDFFLLQHRFPSGIYSHETALYLLGYSDRTPIRITMTFPQGTSSKRVKDEDIRPILISKNLDVGKTALYRNGNEIIVYEIERTLVDLIKPRYEADMEQLIPALKRYARNKNDINKLFEYAKLFGVEQKMHDYMGVLL